MNRKANTTVISAVVLTLGLACTSSDPHPQHNKPSSFRAEGTQRLDSFTIKNTKFVYYKIPRDLEEGVLIATAQNLHELEPDAHLLLIDNDEKVSEYVAYVKSIGGTSPANIEIPREWADKHIIANVQRYPNGRVVLCDGSGHREIAELR